MVFIQDKYKLELHWDNIIKQDDRFLLVQARFQGPALKNVTKLRDKDSVVLDLVSQYIIYSPSFYLVNLCWSGIQYLFDKILLNNCMLVSKNIEFVPKLINTDYIVIDLTDHEATKHPMHLVYKSYVVNKNKEEYNFTEKKLE